MGTTVDLKITWDADRGLRNYVQGDDLVIDSRLQDYYPTITGRMRHGKIGCEDSRKNVYDIKVLTDSNVDLSDPLWAPAVEYVLMHSVSIFTSRPSKCWRRSTRNVDATISQTFNR